MLKDPKLVALLAERFRNAEPNKANLRGVGTVARAMGAHKQWEEMVALVAYELDQCDYCTQAQFLAIVRCKPAAPTFELERITIAPGPLKKGCTCSVDEDACPLHAGKTRCPECGEGIHECETGDPGCMHCNECDWSGFLE